MTKPLGYSLIYWWCLSLPPTTNFKITTHTEYAELSHENIYWCLYSKKPISSACFPLKIQWPFYTCHIIYICSLCSWNALTPRVPCWTEVSWLFSFPGLFVRQSWANTLFCRQPRGSASLCHQLPTRSNGAQSVLPLLTLYCHVTCKCCKMAFFSEISKLVSVRCHRKNSVFPVLSSLFPERLKECCGL